MDYMLSRRSFIRTMTALSASVYGAIAVSSCAPKAEPTQVPQPAQPEAKKEEAAKPAEESVTIKLNMRAGGEKSEAPIYVDRPAEFMEENPNITVELVPIPGNEYYTKIQTMAAAGTLGDVVFAQDDQCQQRRHVVNGLLQVSDEWLDANGHSKNEWFPSVVNALTYEGKMYGLPKSASPSQAFLFYNQDMFEEAGIDFPPEHGVTHDQLAEWADSVGKGPEDAREVYPFSPDVSGILSIHNWVRSFGSFALNEDGTEVLAEGPEWKKAMQYVYEFHARKQVPSAESLPSGGRRALFAAGKLGMIHGGRWEWKGIRAAVEALEEPFNWGVVEMPRVTTAKGWRASVNTHDPSTQTKHTHEAFLLAYALADVRFSELVTQGIGYCTARPDDKDVILKMDDGDPAKSWLLLQNATQAETENFRGPANLRGGELNTITKNFLDQLWLGKEEYSEDFMKRFRDACQEILDKPL